MWRLAALVAAVAWPAAAESVLSARYADPTDRYTHGILGDAIEHGSLILETDAGRTLRLTLPETRVFEDTEPRLADIDGDGTLEAIVVETDLRLGARLSVYGPEGLIAANDFIGRTNRWLSPVGAADLDGDGRLEIAYVDRPHLAKTLRIWRFENGTLVPLGDLPGVTNHRIGEDYISGGIRDCGNGPEMIVADANWQNILSVTFDGKTTDVKTLAPFSGRSSITDVTDC